MARGCLLWHTEHLIQDSQVGIPAAWRRSRLLAEIILKGQFNLQWRRDLPLVAEGASVAL